MQIKMALYELIEFASPENQRKQNQYKRVCFSFRQVRVPDNILEK